jgi:protein-L-isoaspartate(D-aspartate) O-methyltransferase
VPDRVDTASATVQPRAETDIGHESADTKRRALVDLLLEYQVMRTPGVETALRTVPRHLFVPDASSLN